MSILLTLLESLQVVLINMVAILMMPVNLATKSLIKIKSFWNKSDDVIIFVHDFLFMTSPTKFYYMTQIIL